MKIWNDKLIKNETLVLIEDQDGMISGNLLFEPTEIIDIKDYALEKIYNSSEYEIYKNKVTRTKNSSMPYLKQEHLYGINMPLGYDFLTYEGKNKGQRVLYTEGTSIIKHQITVT